MQYSRLYDTIVPLRELWVATDGDDSDPGTEAEPFLTIAHAVSVSLPGDAIILKDGEYEENVRFNVTGIPGGTEEAPKWLIAENPQQAIIIGQETSPRSSVIGCGGVENIVIANLAIDASENTCGILFVDNAGHPIRNIGIFGNLVENAGLDPSTATLQTDGIKCSSGYNVYVDGNTVNNSRDEGIDFVEILTGRISYNRVNGADSTAAGIFWKAGSTNITVTHNHISDVPNGDGISVGGQGGSSGFFPGSNLVYQAFNSTVQHNKIEDVGQNSIVCKGAQGETLVADNYCEVASTYSSNITITSGTNGIKALPSLGVEVTRNRFVGRTNVRVVAPSTANVYGNLTSGAWSTPVGPDQLDPYALATVPGVPEDETPESAGTKANVMGGGIGGRVIGG